MPRRTPCAKMKADGPPMLRSSKHLTDNFGMTPPVQFARRSARRDGRRPFGAPPPGARRQHHTVANMPEAGRDST